MPAKFTRREVMKMVGMIAVSPMVAAAGQTVAAECAPHGSNEISRPRLALPPKSCDCHVHIFNPAQFPYAPERSYTPASATVDDLLCFESLLGVERVVLVQPSVYGTDNRCLVDALQKLGPDRARGIAVVDLNRVTEAELDQLHAAGVRGVRLNLEVKGDSRSAAAAELLRAAERRLARRNWSVQLYADLALVLDIADLLKKLKIRVMLDHFGGAKVKKDSLEQFEALRSLTDSGNVFIKLSAPYRASGRAPVYDDMVTIIRTLVKDDAKGLVWATDWPHTGSSGNRSGDLTKVEPFRKEDDGKTLDLFADWVPSEALRKKIFSENAQAFYGFS